MAYPSTRQPIRQLDGLSIGSMAFPLARQMGYQGCLT